MPSKPPKTYLRDIDTEDREDFRSAAAGTDEFAKGEIAANREELAIVKAREYTKLDGVPVPKPSDLETPEAAQFWAEQEIIKATPRAVQEVINQLKTGSTKKERMVAAIQILDRAGVQQKERAAMVSPVFVLTPESVQHLPWVKAIKEQGGIQDGKVVPGTVTKVVQNTTPSLDSKK